MHFQILTGLFLAFRVIAATILTPVSLCTSDQSCWPSASLFSQLQSQVSQPLIYPHPTAFPCYSGNSSGGCADVTANFLNSTWRTSIPGSMVFSEWETYTSPNGTFQACFLNTSITGMCDQARVPVIGVDARSVADIQAAIQFAVKYRLKLVVKNTGHEFTGRSAARGSFVVWTRNLRNITYDASFVPQGAPEGKAVEGTMTLGAGVEWAEAYAAANDQGRMIVGGSDGNVGSSGGWMLGGGHSPLSTNYGLGVDNVLEISVVLSTGQYLITNEYQNSDLFWAMRGGGGGTYGVVTSVTYRTYPVVPTQEFTYTATVTNASVYPELVEGFLRYHEGFANDGWGGYGQAIPQGLEFIFYGPNMTNETATSSMQEWLNFTESLAPYGVESQTTSTYWSSWYDALVELMVISAADPTTVGYVLYATRLISRDTIADNSSLSKVAQWMINCSAKTLMVSGGKVSQFGADSAGLNPLWRNTVVELACAAPWNETTPKTEVQEIVQQVQGWVQDIYDASPNDGTYFNEASPFEIDWQYTFFGDHYSELKSIKDKYDPHRLFVVSQGVGSEDWNEDLTSRYLL